MRDFNKDFFVTWSPSNVNTSADGRTRSMKLDQESEAGFASNQMFLFGQIDMQIKLVPGDSAGTVVAYYLTSDQPNHDEVDFEFLGHVAGKPYIIQTNMFADGLGNREEKVHGGLGSNQRIQKPCRQGCSISKVAANEHKNQPMERQQLGDKRRQGQN
ncbi:unnamed protein product [Prunus armeniaca]|uniref:GH16 domain-containing protein n=1 Tax=Prunus armeniaca TaxID=36596 RepID=A0A6J5YC36_PRUAR|nr:unnamed protein product [Prunus armeniaca]